jgi:tetratricopeptide (TPR) repeat protein
MAKDAHGDRVTQLDLVDAYSRLGNLQGNPYDQNLGDPAGGLASLDKAIALAGPMASAGSRDQEALRALATAQQSRSEILFGSARTQEAIFSMRMAVQAYERLIAFPDATPNLICQTASAYGTLGDELGQSGTASLADTAEALNAFRASIALDNRALAIDPDFARARRGLSINQMKIGGVEMATDPAQALKDFQMALKQADSLPQAQQSSLSNLRMRNMLLRKEANALVELGEFSKATEIFSDAVNEHRKLASADPQDLRALADLQVVLNDEALCFEAAANPLLAVSPNDRRKNLSAAEKLLSEALTLIGKMLSQDPANETWKSVQADAQVRLGSIEFELHNTGDSAALAQKGLSTMKELVSKDQVSPMILDQAANAFATVKPVSLRDPELAVSCAEREVALNHRKAPFKLLSLAQAYRATGQLEKSRATAAEGLALLPALPPGGVKPSIRKLLEIQAQFVK